MEPEEDSGVVEETTEPTTETRYETPAELKDNPAWNVILDNLPTDLHNVVKPGLKEWDRNVTKKFQEIHDEYAPYKAFTEQGLTPEQISQAVQLMNNIQENPREIWDRMAEYYEFSPAEIKAINEELEETEDLSEDDPRYEQLQETVQTMAQIMLQQQEAEQASTEDAELEQYLSTLHEAHGEFDDQYVLGVMSVNGLDGEAAVKQFNEIIEGRVAAKQAPPAPVVLGAGTAVPSGGLDVTKLDSANTKKLVQDLLAASAAKN